MRLSIPPSAPPVVLGESADRGDVAAAPVPAGEDMVLLANKSINSSSGFLVDDALGPRAMLDAAAGMLANAAAEMVESVIDAGSSESRSSKFSDF